jgi:hypothetical protein
LQRGEPLAPLLDQLLPGLLVVQLAGFFAQAIRPKAAGRQQDMRVVVAVVALLAGGVNRHVCGHAVTVHQLAGEVVRQLFPLCGGKLGGQGYFKLAGYRRVFALLGLLGGVPELGAVACPLGALSGRMTAADSRHPFGCSRESRRCARR